MIHLHIKPESPPKIVHIRVYTTVIHGEEKLGFYLELHQKLSNITTDIKPKEMRSAKVGGF